MTIYDPVAAATGGAVRAYNVTHLGWVMLGLTVVDEDGAPLAGAEVTVDGATHITPASGRVAVQLAAGDYEVALALAWHDSHSVTYTMDRWREEVEAMYAVAPPRVITAIAASVVPSEALVAVVARIEPVATVVEPETPIEGQATTGEIVSGVATREARATVEVR